LVRDGLHRGIGTEKDAPVSSRI